MRLKNVLNTCLAVLTAAGMSTGMVTPAMASLEDASETVPEANTEEALSETETQAVQRQELEVSGLVFDSQTIYEDDDFTVSVSSEDDDLSDGLVWNIHMENRSDQEAQIQFLNTAINNVMCQTEYLGNSSWTVDAGGSTEQEVSWTKDTLQNARVEDAASVDFTLQIISVSQSGLNNSYLLYQPYEINISGKEVPQAQTPEGEDVIAYNDDVIFEILSYGEDSSGLPLMNVYMENHSDDVCMFDLSDVLIGDYSVEPDWSQVVLPGASAYSTVSFFTLDSANGIGDVSKIDFTLRLWKAVPSTPGSYSQWEQFTASVSPDITETVSEEQTQTASENEPETASETGTQTASETETETASETGSETVSETELETSSDVQPDTAAAGAEDTEAQSEPEGIRLADKVGYSLIITDLEDEISQGYYAIDLYISNNSGSKMIFSSDDITFNDYQTDPGWTKELPAGSKVVTEILTDGNELSSNGVPSVDKLSITVRASDENGTLLSDQTYTIDTVSKTVKEITDNLGTSAETLLQEQTGAETTGTGNAAAENDAEEALTEEAESEALTEETEIQTEDAETETQTEEAETEALTEETEIQTEKAAAESSETYDDYNTVLSVQALLNIAGYSVEKSGEYDSATKDAIAKYREAEGLSAGTQIDNELLYSLGTTDSETYKAVQAELTVLGYDVGEIDGLTGRKSREAIADFKAKQGITSDGITKELLEKLEEEAVKAGYQPENVQPETETASETETAASEEASEVSEETAEAVSEEVSEADDENAGAAKTYNNDYETVLSVQALLRNYNYSIEKTGKLDDATKNAISDYRRIKGLSEGSDIDDELLYSLGYTDSESYKIVQEELQQLGYDVGEIDGLTGRKSREALADFKKKHNFTDSGLTDEILDELEKEAVKAGYTVKETETETETEN